MRLIKEPLVHFVILGSLVFWLNNWVNSEDVSEKEKIVVSQGRVEQMINLYQKTWQRPPSPAEITELINDYVLEEVYYRQAVAMGIDKDDTVIRRRMRQKLEFLTEDIMMESEVNDTDLLTYMKAHSDRFKDEPTYSFEQVYINPQKHKANLPLHLSALADRLRTNESVRSDSAFFSQFYEEASVAKLRRNFGRNFDTQLDDLELGQWSEPLESEMGLHFIKMRARSEAKLPPLELIREEVKDAWIQHRLEEHRAALNKKLRDQYELQVDWEGAGI